VIDALSVRNLSKQFQGTLALNDVSFSVRAGEIHGLAGENGSGKSTLVKVLSGVHTPEPGASAVIWGEPVSFPITRPHDHGIAVVHQDLGFVESVSVATNMGVTSSFGTRPSRCQPSWHVDILSPRLQEQPDPAQPDRLRGKSHDGV